MSDDNLPKPHDDPDTWPYGWRWPGEGSWLDQDQEWQPAASMLIQKEPMLINDMTDEHKLNLRLFLREQAGLVRKWHVHIYRKHNVEPEPITDAVAWLDGTVFMRRLARH